MSARTILGAMLLWVGVALAIPAGAEIYRCTGPDGQVRFTGDASQCPGAKEHESKAKVQTYSSTAAQPSQPPPAARTRAGLTEDANAAVWRSKKLQAEQQLAELEARLPGLHRATGWCNRGNVLYRTDDLGRRQTIDCKEVQEEYQRLEQTRDEVAEYLAEGLEEQCRRSNCLPGWIR
ncbi:MAG: DUF4124 domain-containing protein [bacterium]|nr:DUF4124 domain-containing protein [bacterium]